MSFEDVKASLLSKEKFNLEVHSNAKTNGLNVKGKPFGKGRSNMRNFCSKSRGRKSNKVCMYYKKQGHLVDDCYSLKNKREKEERNKQPQKSGKASIVDSKSNSDVLCVITTKNRCVVEWVLDYGCTFHMCPHRDWFSRYEPLESGVVLMGNDAKCNVIGTGTVQIKTHDGIVRTLTNVCHIPDLKHSIISLGIINSNACRYSADKGALVLIEGVRRGSFYVLQGYIVLGFAAFTISSSNINLTRLLLGPYIRSFKALFS